jgi:hypothetical protein
MTHRKPLFSKTSLICFGIVFLAFSEPLYAAIVLDQHNDNVASFDQGFAATFSEYREQGVTAGVTGRLSSFDIYVSQGGFADLFINLGAPWQSDANDFDTGFISISSTGWYSVNIPSTVNIMLHAGDQFALGVGFGSIDFQGTSANGYSGGVSYIHFSNGSVGQQGNADIGFQTYVDTAPEPSSLVIFGTLAACFAGYSHWRRRKQPAGEEETASALCPSSS